MIENAECNDECNEMESRNRLVEWSVKPMAFLVQPHHLR